MKTYKVRLYRKDETKTVKVKEFDELSAMILAEANNPGWCAECAWIS